MLSNLFNIIEKTVDLVFLTKQFNIRVMLLTIRVYCLSHISCTGGRGGERERKEMKQAKERKGRR